jgi:predicted ArsR family transcriptional regulator
MQWPRPFTDRVAAVSALDDPVRRALLDLVTRSEDPVSRDDAAQVLGLSRRAASFHLDRLAEKGLLTVEFRRLSGRTGPGAGRPSKLYRRLPDEVAVSVPERHYDLAGDLLAAAVDESTRTGERARDALLRLARDLGRELGARAGTFDKVVRDHGFEPRPDGDGGTLLANCPFHRLAQRHADTVCHLNLELLSGVAEATGRDHMVVFDPNPGRCCVRALRAAPPSALTE